MGIIIEYLTPACAANELPNQKLDLYKTDNFSFSVMSIFLNTNL